ncbi:MAG: hypothetical protein ABI629_15825 [bacterium]
MPSRPALPPRSKPSRTASDVPHGAAGVDPFVALTCDAFVARCLRRLIDSERAAASLLLGGTPPAAGRASRRDARRVAPRGARRSARVAQPAGWGDWQAQATRELDVARLRRRYPWIVALLRELADH